VIAHIGPLPIEEMFPALMSVTAWLMLRLKRRS